MSTDQSYEVQVCECGAKITRTPGTNPDTGRTHPWYHVSTSLERCDGEVGVRYSYAAKYRQMPPVARPTIRTEMGL
jgi:hypothetical protein